ncbi:MAG: sigma-54-dependent transcriptional regulator [Gammaproteobacteria bacterium]
MKAQLKHNNAEPLPTILIVEDDPNLREALNESLSNDGYATLTASDGENALAMLERHDVGLVISDVQMIPMDGTELLIQIKRRHPELPVVLMTAYGTIQKAVDAMHHGAVHYLVKPFAADTLVETVRRYLPSTSSVSDPANPVAEDPRSQDCLSLAHRVASSDATVMLHGQSGTGKEVYARYIHAMSQRADGPFVAINCAAIPESMLEAVLFGHVKGAFTGAGEARAGKFEQAQGGTLLLDEISEMDMGLQAKLLRVLQEKEVERLGGQKTIALDVRVLATTNRDLREHVDAGHFREDLFYRLDVFPIALPSLAERPLDIVPLALHCLTRCAGNDISLSAGAQEKLRNYGWPGNVRELDNVIQRAVILRGNGHLEAEDIAIDVSLTTAPTTAAVAEQPLQDDLRSKEKEIILAALRAGRGKRKDAAERLGISPRTLRYKLAKMREDGVAIPGGNAA